MVILRRMVASQRKDDDSAESNADAKEIHPRLFELRDVHVFDRLSRDVWPRLGAPMQSACRGTFP